MDQVAFTDSNGVRWSVREDGADDSRVHASSEGVPGTAWLRFDSEYEVRRLWHYPDDWRGLNPLQLESLLDRASTVIARFRSVGHPRPLIDSERPPIAPLAGEPVGEPGSRPASAPNSPTRTRSDDPDAM